MAGVAELTALEATYVGTAENPLGSNNVIFNTDYYGRAVSGSAYPWCAAAQWDLYRMLGIPEAFMGGGKSAYTPTIASWYKQRGQWGSTPQPGALVFYQWASSNRICHIEYVAGVNSDGTNKTFGGNVDDRFKAINRSTKYVVGYAYPDYGDGTAAATETTATVSIGTITRYLRRGATGEDVRRLQTALNSRGESLSADGKFGNLTYAAVVAFQVLSGLEVDGVVGKQTTASLGGTFAVATPTGSSAFPLASGHWYGPLKSNAKNHSGAIESDKDEVKQIQRVVGTNPDGVYGDKTTSAVKAWQKSHSLNADGLVGALTWDKMF